MQKELFYADDLKAALAIRNLIAVPQTLARRVSLQLPTTSRYLLDPATNLMQTDAVNVDAGVSQVGFVTNGNRLKCAFLLAAVGIKFIYSGELTGMTGLAIPTPAPNTPVPAWNGDFAAAPPPGSRPATFDFGSAAQRAALAVFRSRRITMTLGCDVILFDEALSSIGSACVDSEFTGAGDSLLAQRALIRSANDQYRSLGSPFIFVPSTIDAGGAVLPPPMASVMRGSPKLCGNGDGFYALNNPILLSQESSFEITTPLNDNFYLPDLEAVEYPEGGPVTQTYDVNLTGDIAGFPNAGGVVEFIGGSIRMEISFLGWKMSNKACQAYFRDEAGLVQTIQGFSKQDREKLVSSPSQGFHPYLKDITEASAVNSRLAGLLASLQRLQASTSNP